MMQKEINEIKDRAFQSACSYPIRDVVNSCYVGKINGRGDSFFISCPHGCDKGKKPSKLSVSKSKNIFKCFCCGEAGGSLKLRSWLLNETYSESMMALALELGEISHDEYDMVMDPSVRTKLVRDDRTYIHIEQTKGEEQCLAPPDIRNLVYSTMLSMDEFSLTKEMRDYLNDRRGIKNPSGDFFCYHDDFSVDELVRRIQKQKPEFSLNDLYGVPGFYFKYSNKEHTLGQWTFVPKSPSSIGIIIRDAEQRIIALQARNIRKSNTTYYWISSSGRASEAGYDFGASPGSPTHVEYPEQIMTGCVSFIEGFFKVKKLAEISQGLCLAFQGVNNYTYTLEELSAALHGRVLKDRLRKDKRCKLTFAMFYDADMLSKYQVLFAAKGFYGELKKAYPERNVYFYVWQMEEGKGFDDLYENHPVDWKKFLHKIKGDEFMKIMDKSLKETLEHFGMNHPSEAIGEKKQKFEAYLYDMSWKQVRDFAR